MGSATLTRIQCRRKKPTIRTTSREAIMVAASCPYHRPFHAIRKWLLIPVTIVSLLAAAQEAKSGSLHGIVRDEKGMPVPLASLVLKNDQTGTSTTVTTDSRGAYTFTGLTAGTYSLRVTKSGLGDTEAETIVVAVKQDQTRDFVFKNSAAVAVPQFFDQPQFVVSGVVDTTALGGHGSDTVVRTRESIAKDTATLGKIGPSEAPEDVQASLKAGDYARASDEVRRLISTDDKPELHHLLAQVEEKQGNSLESVHEYERAAQLDPSEPYLFDWGSELLLHHAPEPAEQVFTKGNKLFPKSMRMLLGLGAASFGRGSYDEAVKRICEASDLNSNDPTPYVFLGTMQRAENSSSEEVVEKLHRFAILQPQNAEAQYNYAIALWKQNRNSHNKSTAGEIESLLMSAVRIDPKFAPAELQLGIVKAEQGDYSSAIAHYKRAIEVDPALEEAHFRLSQAYRQTGQAEQAKQELKAYQELSKESAKQADRERHEIPQFVYILRDQPRPPTP